MAGPDRSAFPPNGRTTPDGRGLRPAPRILRAAVAALAPAAGLFIVSCSEGTPSIFRTESQQGRDIETLTYIIFAILAAILLAVWGLLFVSIIRDRRRPESKVKQTHGNLLIEIIWTIIPAIIVAVLFALTLQTTAALDPPSTSVRFQVTGHQWWWEIEYAEADFKTANEIHVPVNRGALAELLSEDVIHSYWVPQMGGKVDMIPGHVRAQEFLPVTQGTFLGECSEFCGHQHGNMRFLLIVESARKFSEWFANESRPARQPQGTAAEAGAQLFAGLPCAGCHTIRGTEARGEQGPDLTHFGSRRGIAALTLTNTPENLRAWLRDPQAVKPENEMPVIPLSAPQLEQIATYMEGLR